MTTHMITVSVSTGYANSKFETFDTGMTKEEWDMLTEEEQVKIALDCMFSLIEWSWWDTEDKDG